MKQIKADKITNVKSNTKMKAHKNEWNSVQFKNSVK